MPGLRAILRSPWALIALAAALWVDGATQPWTTTAGQVFCPRSTHCFFPQTATVVRAPAGGFLCVDDEAGDPQCRVYSFHRPTLSGFWAPTSMALNTTLHFYDAEFEGSLSASDRAAVRIAYADYLADHQCTPELISALRAGEGTTRTPLPSGYIHNAFILLLAAAFAYSLCSLPAYLRSLALTSRRHRAIATDLCPTCLYDRRGLAPDSPCPECGARTTTCPNCGRGPFTDTTCPDCGAPTNA